jgi:heme/copper-type cytochrome/quinol oxidase subunit 2
MLCIYVVVVVLVVIVVVVVLVLVVVVVVVIRRKKPYVDGLRQAHGRSAVFYSTMVSKMVS